MNVLFFGISPHNSSLVRYFSKSTLVDKIYICAEMYIDCKLNENVEFIEGRSVRDYRTFLKEREINFVVILQAPHYAEYVNIFKYNFSLPTLGVTRYWAQLESSKLFGKEFMQKYGLPCSEYSLIKSIKELEASILKFGLPLVIKDNTMQAGFGVHICKTKKECIDYAKKLLKKDGFCIAEKYIEGKEVTLHTIWDGEILLPLEPVKDYKRLENGDKGINTGSMGSYVPALLTEKERELMFEYVKKLEQVFKTTRPNFTGIFVSDLIFSDNKVYNLEFNMRPGTPEFEALIEHFDCDIFEVLYKTAISKLKDVKISYKSGYTGAVNVVHKDYKKQISKDRKKKVKIPNGFLTDSGEVKIIAKINKINEKQEAFLQPYSKVFTLVKNDVLNPFPEIYKHISKLKDKNLYYRTDIGRDLQERI